MTGIFISGGCTNFFLIRWVAQILGVVLNLFYEVLAKFGIAKISICVIVLTIFVRLVMVPINIKQQKSMKLNSVVTPEIQEIQKKYANKRDNESMMKQQQEMNAVYQKYGTSPASGCLPLLIQMPIILGLYAMIAQMPNYINDLQDLYNDDVVETIVGAKDEEHSEGYVINSLKDVYYMKKTLAKDEKTEELDSVVENYLKNDSGKIESYGSDNQTSIKEKIYMSFTSSYDKTFKNNDVWEVVEDSFTQAQDMVNILQKLEEEDWEKLQESNERLYVKYSGYTESDWYELTTQYKQVLKKLDESNEEVKKVYSMFTINLSKSPANDVKIAIIIPILSALVQFLNMKISMRNQQKTGNETTDSMMSSMKVMSYSMCFVSAFFCYTLPAAVGLYWVISSLIQGVIQFILNKHFDKMDVNDIIKENIEKLNKKREKAGLPPNVIATAAAVNTKNYSGTATNQAVLEKKDEPVKKVPAKKGSIADKANAVQNYLEKK